LNTNEDIFNDIRHSLHRDPTQGRHIVIHVTPVVKPPQLYEATRVLCLRKKKQ